MVVRASLARSGFLLAGSDAGSMSRAALRQQLRAGQEINHTCNPEVAFDTALRYALCNLEVAL
jgi:hypothetical protein